jgi:hypothetical protein
MKRDIVEATPCPVGAHWGATGFPGKALSRPSALLRQADARMQALGNFLDFR